MESLVSPVSPAHYDNPWFPHQSTHSHSCQPSVDVSDKLSFWRWSKWSHVARHVVNLCAKFEHIEATSYLKHAVTSVIPVFTIPFYPRDATLVLYQLWASAVSVCPSVTAGIISKPVRRSSWMLAKLLHRSIFLHCVIRKFEYLQNNDTSF